MRGNKRVQWALVIAAVAALVLAAAAAARTHSAAKGPIVIGWAYDNNGIMAPFDGPALAAAKTSAPAATITSAQRARLLALMFLLSGPRLPPGPSFSTSSG